MSSPRRRRPLKWLLVSLAVIVVLVGLTFGAFGLIVAHVPEYRVQVQDWLNERTGLIVEFRTLKARLRRYGPELVFDDAIVRTPDRTRVIATAQRGSVGFDLWTSLASGRLTTGRFSLESPEIGFIRTREGRIQLAGQSALPERSEPFAIEQLPTGRFRVDNAVVSFRDEITGRGPWSLSGVSFELNRGSTSMTVRGNASLPKALGGAFDFNATAEGALEQADAVASKFTIVGTRIDLAGWAEVLPDEWPVPQTGIGSMKVSVELQGPVLTQVAAQVDFRQVRAMAPVWSIPLPTAAPLDVPPDADEQTDDTAVEVAASDTPTTTSPQALAANPEPLTFERVAFVFNARREQEGWNAALTNLETASGDVHWRSDRITAHWARDASGRFAAGGEADRVVLDALWPMLAFLPESESLAGIRALAARGTITDAGFDFDRASAEAAPEYSLKARFAGLTIAPVARRPGIAGFSGEVTGTHEGGQAVLATRDARFELPRLFRWPLDVRAMTGTLTWKREGPAWKVASDQLDLENVDGRAQARLALSIPDDGSSPIIDLSAVARDLNARSTPKYLPAGRMRSKLLAWLDAAIVDGRAPSAELTLQGPLRSFPFRGEEGLFLVRGQIEGVTFNYQPGWMPATDLTGDVEFRNAGMSIRSRRAVVGGQRVSDASARIADFRKGLLAIHAQTRGDLQQALAFLRASPLGPVLGERFERLEGSGRVDGTLDLALPLKRIADRNVVVTTRLTDANVALRGIDGPATHVSGSLTIRNTLVAEADLEGDWLGGPAKATIRQDAPDAASLNAQGVAVASELRALLHLPPTISLGGDARWRAATVLRSGVASDATTRTVTIESDTNGLALELPEPVGKSAQEARPLKLDLEFAPDGQLLARGSFGLVRALVRLNYGDRGWELDRGGVRADGLAPALPNHPGFRIEGVVDRFVLDDWFALKGSGGGGGKLSDYLRSASVTVREFQLYGYRWPDVRGILQVSDSGWRVDVTGPNASGQIIIPEDFTGSQPLRAALEHLVLTRVSDAPATEPAASRDPRGLPGVDAHVASLQLDTRNFGSVDLRMSKVPDGVSIDSLTIAGPSLAVDARGEWLNTSTGPATSLTLKIVSTDVAATQRGLGVTPFIEAKHGEIRASLSWPGGFDGDFLSRASGGLTVHLDSGQILSLQPGAGRVIGLLSVAALPRRLALDFSDLTDKGLSFDTVNGDFELRSGNAHTTNLVLRGPAAEIGIAGRTGLGARDYDQTAVVTGNIGASLPVAGAVVGGPVVGAAILLFTQVFKEPLKGIARGYYRITGTWDNPIVERVDASEVKDAAASRN